MNRRVVFVTGHEFGFAALNGMLASNPHRRGAFSVPLLITLETSARQATVGYADQTELDGFSGEIATTSDGRLSAVLPRIRDIKPAFIFVVGWSYLVPRSVLDMPSQIAGAAERHSATHGCVGMHPTLLPRGRGRAPLPWTILHGDEVTGLTVFRLEEEADAGDVVWQKAIEVHQRETATSLFSRVRDLHRRAGRDVAGLIGSGAVRAEPQDHVAATCWPKRNTGDSEIAPTLTLSQVDRLIRAQAEPYPNAFVAFEEGRRFVAMACIAQRIDPSHGQSGVLAHSTDWVDLAIADSIVRLIGHWDQ